MVERCVCYDISLAEVRRRVAAGETVAEVSKESGCGTGCGLCRAYILAAIEKGVDRVAVMGSAEFRVYGERAERVLGILDEKR
ncbi:hypothetical protein BH11PLA1_BH11PLA1_09720 [soil metagenome]